MIERFERRAFPPKPAAHCVVREVLGMQHLDRHLATLRAIDGLVDGSDPSVRQLCNQLVAAGQSRSDTDGGRLRHSRGLKIPLFFQTRPTGVRFFG